MVLSKTFQITNAQTVSSAVCYVKILHRTVLNAQHKPQKYTTNNHLLSDAFKIHAHLSLLRLKFIHV